MTSFAAARPFHAVRFVRGLRRFLRQPLTPDEARTVVAAEQVSRGPRFLATLDELVWSVPTSPTLALLRHAGIERGDLANLVSGLGVEGALVRLRDAGVYVAHEEACGHVPLRRGSLELQLTSADFFNPRRPADFIAGTSGSTGHAVPVAASFASLRRMAVDLLLTAQLWDVTGRPAALWRPALPASGGLIVALAGATAGDPAERWFSQVRPTAAGVPFAKRAANVFLPLAAAGTGRAVPRPRYVAASDTAVVLEWCTDALRRAGRASLNVYPSGAVKLAAAAGSRGVSLEGLVLRLVGEPVTDVKAAAIRAVGAEPVNAYAFAQQGVAGTACRHCDDEQLHLFDHDLAVIDRCRPARGGGTVRALLFTNLSADARSAWVNVENDDRGDLSDDTEPCRCLLGALGLRRRVSRVRGLSKSVAAGVTIAGDTLERLAEAVLPGRFGGGPADWQLAEEQRADGTTGLVVRVAADLGWLDDAEVVDCVLTGVRKAGDVGALAAAVWAASASIRVARESPVAGAGAKALSYVPLPPP